MTTEAIELKYTPYRGKTEPIIEDFGCKVYLHKEYIETILNYTYPITENGIKKEGRIKRAYLQKRDAISLTRTMYREAEDSDELYPAVDIYDGETAWLGFEKDEDADKMYSKIKKWIMA